MNEFFETLDELLERPVQGVPVAVQKLQLIPQKELFCRVHREIPPRPTRDNVYANSETYVPAALKHTASVYERPRFSFERQSDQFISTFDFHFMEDPSVPLQPCAALDEESDPARIAFQGAVLHELAQARPEAMMQAASPDDGVGSASKRGTLNLPSNWSSAQAASAGAGAAASTGPITIAGIEDERSPVRERLGSLLQGGEYARRWEIADLRNHRSGLHFVPPPPNDFVQTSEVREPPSSISNKRWLRVDCSDLVLDALGETSEPFMCTICLVDCATQSKLTEQFYLFSDDWPRGDAARGRLEMPTAEEVEALAAAAAPGLAQLPASTRRAQLMSMRLPSIAAAAPVRVARRSFMVPLDEAVVKGNGEIMLILCAYRVYQGDVENSWSFFCSAPDGKKRAQFLAQAATVRQVYGARRQLFAWGFLPLTRSALRRVAPVLTGVDESMLAPSRNPDGEFLLGPKFMPIYKAKSIDLPTVFGWFGNLENSGINRKNQIPGRWSSVLSFVGASTLPPCINTLGMPMTHALCGKRGRLWQEDVEMVRVVELLPKPTTPWLSASDLVFVTVESIDLTRENKTTFRMSACCRYNDLSANLSLHVSDSAMGQVDGSFAASADTAIVHSQRVPGMCDEFKIAIPTDASAGFHMVLRLYSVSFTEKATGSEEYERLFGYAVLPLVSDAGLLLSGYYELRVYQDLAPHYLHERVREGLPMRSMGVPILRVLVSTHSSVRASVEPVHRLLQMSPLVWNQPARSASSTVSPVVRAAPSPTSLVEALQASSQFDEPAIPTPSEIIAVLDRVGGASPGHAAEEVRLAFPLLDRLVGLGCHADPSVGAAAVGALVRVLHGWSELPGGCLRFATIFGGHMLQPPMGVNPILAAAQFANAPGNVDVVGLASLLPTVIYFVSQLMVHAALSLDVDDLDTLPVSKRSMTVLEAAAPPILANSGIGGPPPVLAPRFLSAAAPRGPSLSITSMSSSSSKSQLPRRLRPREYQPLTVSVLKMLDALQQDVDVFSECSDAVSRLLRCMLACMPRGLFLFMVHSVMRNELLDLSHQFSVEKHAEVVSESSSQRGQMHFLPTLVTELLKPCLAENETALEYACLLYDLVCMYDPTCRGTVATMLLPLLPKTAQAMQDVVKRSELFPSVSARLATVICWIAYWCPPELLRMWLCTEVPQTVHAVLSMLTLFCDEIMTISYLQGAGVNTVEASLITIIAQHVTVRVARFLYATPNELSTLPLIVRSSAALLSGVLNAAAQLHLFVSRVHVRYSLEMFAGVSAAVREMVQRSGAKLVQIDGGYELLLDLLMRQITYPFGCLHFEAAALIYMLLKCDYEHNGSLARTRMAMTVALSRQLSHAVFGHYIHGGVAIVKTLASVSVGSPERFRADVERMCSELDDIVERTREVREAMRRRLDRDSIHVTVFGTAQSYRTAPEMQLTWLDNLADMHVECKNYAEAAATFTAASTLVHSYLCSASEYASSGTIALWRRDGASLFGNHLLGDGTLPLVLNPAVTGPEFAFGGVSTAGSGAASHVLSMDGLQAYLQKAIEMYERAEMFESAVEAYRPLCLLLASKRDFGALQKAYAHCAALVEASERLTKAQSRFLGTYYLLRFFGDVFRNTVDIRLGAEYVYKAPKLMRIPEMKAFLEGEFGAFCGGSITFLQTAQPPRDGEVDPLQPVIQLVPLAPFLDDAERRRRTTDAERQVNVDAFLYEVPFTAKGERFGAITEQQKRKHIVRVERPFPFVLARQRVCEHRTIELTAVDNAIETVQQQTDKLRAAIEIVTINFANIEMLLQGSVRLQVNAGPVAIYQAFLEDAAVRETLSEKQVAALRECFFDFAMSVSEAMDAHHMHMDSGSHGLRHELEAGMRELVATLSRHVPRISADPMLRRVLDAAEDAERASGSMRNSIGATSGAAPPLVPSPAPSAVAAAGAAGISPATSAPVSATQMQQPPPQQQ